MLNFRTYLIIGIAVGAICSAVAYFDTGGAFASIFITFGNSASPYIGDNIANLITQPLANIFTNIYWAVAAGIFWPLVVFWFGLFILLLGVAIAGPVFAEVNSTV